MGGLIGAYVPGRSPLHRTPAALKILLIIAVGVTTVITSDPSASVALAAAGLAFYVSVTPPWRSAVRLMGWTVVIAAFASAYHLWVGNTTLAIMVACNLLAVVFTAVAVTVSTPMESMLDVASTALRPLRRVVPHETVGLMFAITVRLIPQMAGLIRESTMAAKARGLQRSPRAILTPTVVRSVGFAIDLGAALHARGIGDDAARP